MVTDTHGYADPDEVTRADAEVTVGVGLEPPEHGAPFERGETFGRYVVLDKLGAGGMGVVLAAYDSQLNRRVALKLLHAHASQHPENYARLQREAQALAKLSHPRVVSVYDVGELRGQVFIAMEFIDGPNVRQWLRAQPRTPSQILAVFRGAGKGLQAAHDAGIVHRDFKPDNVLIGPGGKAYVTDFGLAHEANAAPDTPCGSESRSAPSRLTETGTVMGTPAYMPIEQHTGLPTDHRSDQFSFCVSLFEALHGVRPFSGINSNELCLAIGGTKFPPRPKGVSRKVHRALLRGLSPRAKDRFPTMHVLLRALAPRTRQSRTWIVGGIAGLGVGAALVAFGDPSPAPCASVGKRVKQVYGAEQRESLQAAFSGTGLPYAQASFAATAETLDAFAVAWESSAQNFCLASDRGAQSGEMLDLRMLCLERGLHALSATLEILSEPGPDEIRESARISGRLPDLALCDDLEALPKLAVLPSTPEQAHEAETLLPVLERIRAFVFADRLDDAQALLEARADEFRSSAYPLVSTLYRTCYGRYLFERRDDRAQAALEEAHLMALEHGLRGEASRSANTLGSLHSQPSQLETSLRWFAVATALARAGGSRSLEATALSNASVRYSKVGRHDEAVARSRGALELVAGVPGHSPHARIELLLGYAEALQRRDGGDAGDEQIREARELIHSLDADASVISKLETWLSERALLRGDYDASRRHAVEALRITELHFGPRSLRYAFTIANLGAPLQEMGELAEALDCFTTAADILEEFPSYADGRALLLTNTANLLLVSGQYAQMRDRLEQLDTVITEHQLEETEMNALALQLRSSLGRIEGDLEVARTHATQAVEIMEDLFGEKHHRTADARTALAYAELEAGNHALARRVVERAREADTTVPSERGIASFVLARALWEAGDASEADRRRALGLARSAAEDFEDAPGYARDAANVDAWLKAHDRGFNSG